MSVTKLRSLERTFLNDGTLSLDDANKLIRSTSDGGAVTAAEKSELRAIIQRNSSRMEPAAKAAIEQFLGVAPTPNPQPPTPPANSAVIRAVAGTNPGSFEDDTVFLGRDGTLHGESSVPAYTRSYDSMKDGPLRSRHGSAVPNSTIISAADLAAAKKNTPGQALDAAAAAFGTSVDGFEKMANSKNFYDPSAEYWWGKCHAWTWSSLSTEVDKLVDVPGAAGERGLWVGGQFLSRADLGDWMMAVSDTIALRDGNHLFDSSLSALDVLKGTTQYLMNNGGGMVADVWNDAAKGHREVWNQPFVSSDVTNKTLSGAVATSLLDLATRDGIQGATGVKQVSVVGTYGVEVSDSHEGDPSHSSKTWNMYAITDANGKVLTAYMANDKKLANIASLPTKTTDDVPDYFWKPTLQAINDTLAGRPNSTVNNNEHGREFSFFVGTVLKKGVPAQTRKAFEGDFQALPAGAVSAAKAAELAQKYPGVANAYSPDQWKTLFAPRGLDAAAFGAAWPRS